MKKIQPAVRWFWLVLLATALACSTLAGSGSSKDNSKAPSAGTLPDKTYLGDYISYEGYFFAVLQVQDPAPSSGNAGSIPGNRDVALEIIAGNHNGGGFSPVNTSFGGLGDGSGHVYGADLSNFGSGDGLDLTGYFDRGESAQGWMVFSIPETVQPLELTLSLANPAGGWRSFEYGLTPPPAGYAPLRADTSRSSPERAAFGKAAEKNGCSLKALQVQDNLNSIPSVFFSLPPETRVVGVQIEIRAAKDSGARIVDLSLADTDGHIYRMKGSEIIQSQGKLILAPGEAVQDWVYFVVPADAAIDVVRLICASNSHPAENIVLRSALS